VLHRQRNESLCGDLVYHVAVHGCTGSTDLFSF